MRRSILVLVLAVAAITLLMRAWLDRDTADHERACREAGGLPVAGQCRDQ